MVWAKLLQVDARLWSERLAGAKSGQRVLMATSLGGYNHGAMVESALAIAATLRGAQVDVLLCDRALSLCQITKLEGFPEEDLIAGAMSPRCIKCYPDGQRTFEPLGLDVHVYSDLLDPETGAVIDAVVASAELRKLRDLTLLGCSVGEHAYAGILRYLASGEALGHPRYESIARSSLTAALRTAFAVNRLLSERRYDVVCMHHGIYIPQGIVAEVCRQRGVRVVTWNPTYRQSTFIFSHGETYHRSMVSEDPAVWESLALDVDNRRGRLQRYMASRRDGSADWVHFNRDPKSGFDDIAGALGLDPRLPIVTLLTNVLWDAQLHFPGNAFAGMLDWVRTTIDLFARRNDIQLVIRVHPAELTGSLKSRQPIIDEIARWYPELPRNVFIVGPDSTMSTYEILDHSDTAIIFGTKTGIEIAYMGKPVIVAGEAWIRGKGFALDASSAEEYAELIAALPLGQGLDGDRHERARRYAYHFFFRRMIPLPFFEMGQKQQLTPKLSSIRELEAGGWPGLDVICDGILTGAPFIYEGVHNDESAGNDPDQP